MFMYIHNLQSICQLWRCIFVLSRKGFCTVFGWLDRCNRTEWIQLIKLLAANSPATRAATFDKMMTISWSSGTCALSWYILNISIYHILIDGWMDTAPGYDGIFVLHFTDMCYVQPQALYIEALLQCSHPNRWRISNQPFLRLGLWHLSADLWERSKKHPLCFFSPGIWWQPQRGRDVKQQDV